MRSGTLRDKIQMLASVPTTDSRFGRVEGFIQYADVWANVTAIGGTETVVNQGVQTEVTHTICMRFRDDVTSTDRIAHQGQTLEILSVIDPTGKRRELLIQAKLYPGVNQ